MFELLNSSLAFLAFAFMLFLGFIIYHNILKKTIESKWSDTCKSLEERADNAEEELRAFQRGLDLPIYNRRALQDELWNRANLGDENSYYILLELLNSEIDRDDKKIDVDVSI